MNVVKDKLHAKFLQNYLLYNKTQAFNAEYFSNSFSERYPEYKIPIKNNIQQAVDDHYFIDIEIPYNFYGFKGWVDLVEIIKGIPNVCKNVVFLTELKTQLQDIGETIRQVKRMNDYFLKGCTIIKGLKVNLSEQDTCHSKLIILDTQDNIDIFQKYRTLFNGIHTEFWTLHCEACTKSYNIFGVVEN